MCDLCRGQQIQQHALGLIIAEHASTIADGATLENDDQLESQELLHAAGHVLDDITGQLTSPSPAMDWAHAVALQSRERPLIERIVLAATLVVREIERMRRQLLGLNRVRPTPLGCRCQHPIERHTAREEVGDRRACVDCACRDYVIERRLIDIGPPSRRIA